MTQLVTTRFFAVVAVGIALMAPASAQDSTDAARTPDVTVTAAGANTAAVGLAVSAKPAGVLMADRVLVRKSQRRMYLLRDGAVLREFRIALGLSPTGAKQQEGDFRTPEGQYRLVRRNPHSDFFLSMQVSYPNESDAAAAQRRGVRPGGAIMIHGWPNNPRKTADYYRTADWTDGCIAMTNSDMVDFWLMTPLDTPIEIQP